jgi:hypothetical protein
LALGEVWGGGWKAGEKKNLNSPLTPPCAVDAK